MGQTAIILSQKRGKLLERVLLFFIWDYRSSCKLQLVIHFSMSVIDNGGANNVPQLRVVLNKARPRVWRYLSNHHYVFINNALAENDELTAKQLKDLMAQKWADLKRISLTTIKKARKYLSYCSERRKQGLYWIRQGPLYGVIYPTTIMFSSIMH